MRKLWTLALTLAFSTLAAQTDTLQQIPTEEDLLESFAEDQGEEISFDYNELNDRLEYLSRRPLDLNRATLSDLDDFLFLSTWQKQSFLEYRRYAGNLISIYELQAVPGFDLETIRQLLPFVRVRAAGLLDDPLSLFEKEHRSQLTLRWSGSLEAKKGFLGGENSYLGDPNRLFLRYRFTQSDRLSLGLTAEKDPGEEFFKGSNRQGFDFYSVHFFVKNPIEKLNAIALGDYSISLGQGLLVYQGFAPRKSAMTTTVNRGGHSLRPYRSVNEVDFFRGLASSVALSKNIEFLAFASTRRRDANLGELQPEPDTDEPILAYLSSLQTSGLHRTPSEIANKNAVRQSSIGGSLRYRWQNGHVALNGLYEHLDKPLQRKPQLYNRFYFSGNQLLNLSLDYTWSFRNLYFFGETARSNNGAVATLNGLLLPLDRRVSVVVLHRYFPKDYQALNPKPFAESAGGNNEQGMYFGVHFQPHRQWRFNGYYDLWSHPWAKFGVDRPSTGYEWLTRMTYTIRRRMEVYFQLKNELKSENASLETQKTKQLVERQNFQARLHFSYKIGGGLEWRSRVDAGFTKIPGQHLSGMAVYQELIYRSMGRPLSFSTRFAVFDTEGYGIRFYTYERDVAGDFSIPAYYNRGSKFYLTAGYRLGRQLRLEARIARSWYPDLDKIGSGLDEIAGSFRTDAKFQVRWEF